MSEAKCLTLPLLFLVLFCSVAESRYSITSKPQPAASSFKINSTTAQNVGSCSYTVRFTTSCSSPTYTRDQISLSFGDAYGNQVYVPRIDDPKSGAFEACSVDTYDIRGPCAYDICYLYVYRSGYDGWKLNTVEVYGYNTRAITFYYNSFIPNNVWYGFDYCYDVSASA